jgi:hypothetical protein
MMVRYCKNCGGILEFGLPYHTKNGIKVVNLWCYYCNKIAKTFKLVDRRSGRLVKNKIVG